MNKRILALLLAGLLTASMASCKSSTGKRDDSTGGSEPVQTQVTPDPSDPSATVTWTEVNETVYVTKNTTATGVSDSTQSLALTEMTALTRVKVGSNGKSIVEKDGVQYYVLSTYLSTEDLLGESFETCTTELMYSTESGVNVRKYASTSASSLAKLNTNDTVRVVAKSEKWVKVMWGDGFGFVNRNYVSSSPVIDHNDMSQYPSFEDFAVENRFKVFTVQNLNLRQAPSTSSSQVTLLPGDAELMVLAEVTVDGTLWYKVRYEEKGTNGQGDTPYIGFVTTKYVAKKLSLDEMIAKYTEFTKLAETVKMYATGSVRARTSPSLENDDNIAFTLKLKDEITVVATGTKGDVNWAMVEKNGNYYFVSRKYLTTQADGTADPLTLDEILIQYPTLTRLETPKAVQAVKVTNCNPTPKEYDLDEIKTQLQKDAVVTVYAQGEINYKTWYVFEKDGAYYFAGSEMFVDVAAPQG